MTKEVNKTAEEYLIEKLESEICSFGDGTTEFHTREIEHLLKCLIDKNLQNKELIEQNAALIEMVKELNTEKYTLLMYYVHSYLESVRHELKITKRTTVENFRNIPENEKHCKQIFEHSLTEFNYELSYNQIANGINLLLKSYNK